MRYEHLALLSTILGIMLLFTLQFLLPTQKINTAQDILHLKDNQKVSIDSTVLTQNTKESYTSLKLENNLTISCSCRLQDLENKKITAIVQVDRFNAQTQLNILKITYHD